MNILKFADLYQFDIITTYLIQKGFNFVSYRRNSIPSDGSPCIPVESCKFNNDLQILKVIKHRNNKITIKTNKSYIQFIKI